MRGGNSKSVQNMQRCIQKVIPDAAISEQGSGVAVSSLIVRDKKALQK